MDRENGRPNDPNSLITGQRRNTAEPVNPTILGAWKGCVERRRLSDLQIKLSFTAAIDDPFAYLLETLTHVLPPGKGFIAKGATMSGAGI
eukprot:g8983.t1